MDSTSRFFALISHDFGMKSPPLHDNVDLESPCNHWSEVELLKSFNSVIVKSNNPAVVKSLIPVVVENLFPVEVKNKFFNHSEKT